ncbi:MAG: hypothetical protein WC412_04965 [Candidatus Omnitrophota bacterium]|jgi:hypothetical protein
MIDNSKKLLDYFSLLKQKSLIGRSYLFVGDNFELVRKIVKLINCKEDKNSYCDVCFDCKKFDEGTHPDLFLVEPKSLNITIETIRESRQFIRLKSFSANKKVIIIKEAENLGEAAANAFLKTLEEPPKNSFIAVCAEKIDSLLPTIVSRCSKIFLPYSESISDDSQALLVKSFLSGQMPEFKGRIEFSSFIWTLAVLLRDRLLSQAGQNNRLLKEEHYEIIHRDFKLNSDDCIEALRDIFEIYAASATINEKLALNIIKERLQ